MVLEERLSVELFSHLGTRRTAGRPMAGAIPAFARKYAPDSHSETSPIRRPLSLGQSR